MKWPRLKLRTRITLYFVGLLVGWSIFVVASLGYLLSQTTRQFLREHGVEIARSLTLESAPMAQREDLVELEDLFGRYVGSSPEIRYIMVLDGKGQLVASTFLSDIPAEILAITHRPHTPGDVSVQPVRFQNELLYDYECRKANICLRLGLSLAPIQALVWQTIKYILWIGLAGLLAVFALALYISRPVETLTRAIERAVLLDQRTGGITSLEGTIETTTIASRFQKLLSDLEERTRQLDASKKLAYLGEISANIAHEVNNPLGVIVMNSDFLAKRVRAGELSPAAAEEVGRLCLAAKRATSAVQKLLQFARYSMHDSPPKHRPIAWEPLIRETLGLLEDRLQLSGCAVDLDIPDLPPTMAGDEQGLQQVLFNLLTNAIDASSQKGRIQIRITRNSHFLSLQVTDQGSGMNPETLRRAKEPFFTTKELGRGTGLGLAISDSIVRTHGGELALETQPGRGTTATVRLPLKESP